MRRHRTILILAIVATAVALVVASDVFRSEKVITSYVRCSFKQVSYNSGANSKGEIVWYADVHLIKIRRSKTSRTGWVKVGGGNTGRNEVLPCSETTTSHHK